MKKLLLLLIIGLSNGLCAQTRPNIDTITLYNLVPGLKVEEISARVQAPLDTMVWDDNNHNGIIKFVRGYQGIHGEYRLAIDAGKISQVIFTAPVKDNTESLNMYKRLTEMCQAMYAEPDVNYYNAPYREMRWEGMQQSVSVKTRDNTTYVSLVLSKFERRR